MAAFPNNPTNGQQATVNGITYTYTVPPGVWAVTTVPSGNATVSQLNATTIVASGALNAGTLAAGGTAIGSAGLTVNGTPGNDDSQLILKKPSQSAYSVLAWNSATYQGFNLYYENAGWVQSAPSGDNNNALFAFESGAMRWYASNNGTGSWNVASSVPLWSQAGAWNGAISTPSNINTTGNIGIGTGSPAVSLDAGTRTDGIRIPNGTTAQRPGTPSEGIIRVNTSFNNFEFYSAGSWKQVNTSYIVEYLIVAGGGGGSGAHSGGGGGAGGYLTSTFNVSSGVAFNVIVGGGGAGGGGGGGNGQNSSVFGISAIGGGQGGVEAGPTSGASGGSGGGGAGGQFTGAAGAGTAGQGNNGGIGNNGSSNYGSGGGGGGAGGAGGNGVSGLSASNAGATGGIGRNTNATWATATGTGVSGYYAGGGGGGCWNNGAFGQGAAGGLGGGGAGANDGTGSGSPGTANTGGGGGGSPGSTAPRNGGAGGSGIVILRYAGSQIATGGTVVTSGGFTYHTFTTSGTFTA